MATKKKLKRKVKPAAKPNTRFPGKPHYTGPTRGMFAFAHHAVLCEWSNNIKKRVRYVRKFKPKGEQRTRLNHIMFVGRNLNALMTKRGRHLFYGADKLIMAQVERHNPKHTWNGHTLVFPDDVKPIY